MKFEIPADADSADDLCVELGDLVTAAEFKRSALVYARVHVQSYGGDRGNQHTGGKVKSDLAKTGKVTPEGYARKGIHGLRSKTTVRRYWNVWQRLVNEGYVDAAELGDEVEIPEDLEWNSYYLPAADADEPIVDEELDPLKPQKRQPKQPAPGTEPSTAAQGMGKGDCPPKAEFVPEEDEQEFRDVPLPEMETETDDVFDEEESSKSAFNRTLFRFHLGSAKREIVSINQCLSDMDEDDELPEGSKAALAEIIESWTDIQNAVSKKEEEVNEYDEENTDI